MSTESLKACNQVLIYKCRWRFLNDYNLHWVKVIKSCYCNDGGFLMAAPYKENQGVWMGIVKLVWDLHVKCLIPFDSMCKKVGNGANTSFWLDF